MRAVCTFVPSNVQSVRNTQLTLLFTVQCTQCAMNTIQYRECEVYNVKSVQYTTHTLEFTKYATNNVYTQLYKVYSILGTLTNMQRTIHRKCSTQSIHSNVQSVTECAVNYV